MARKVPRPTSSWRMRPKSQREAVFIAQCEKGWCRKVAPRRERAWGETGTRVKYLFRVRQKGGKREMRKNVAVVAVMAVSVATAGGVEGHIRAVLGGGV